MKIEFQEAGYDYNKDGWEQRYLNAYGDLNGFRLKVLLQDRTISKVLQYIYEAIDFLNQNEKQVLMLDVGCGTGHQLMQVAHLCDKAIGFDISEEIVTNNNKLNTNATFIFGNALDYPKFENKFNILLMAGILYDIGYEKEIHQKIFEEAFNNLEDDGYFIFYHRGYLNAITNLRLIAQIFIDKLKNRTKERYYMCWFDDKYVAELLTNQGFKIEKIDKDDFAYPLVFGLPSSVFEKSNADGYVSEKRLNFFGKVIYFFAKNFFPKLSARTSIFIARKI